MRPSQPTPNIYVNVEYDSEPQSPGRVRHNTGRPSPDCLPYDQTGKLPEAFSLQGKGTLDTVAAGAALPRVNSPLETQNGNFARLCDIMFHEMELRAFCLRCMLAPYVVRSGAGIGHSLQEKARPLCIS